MKTKFFLGIIAIFLLPCSVAAAENFDAYVAFGLGKMRYKLYDCVPGDCGGVTETTAIPMEMKLGAYYRSGRMIEPGVEINWMQTLDGMHSHDIGAVDGRVGTLVVLARINTGNIQPYAGVGMGTDVTKMNFPDRVGDCNHSNKIVVAGVKYFTSPKIALFFEAKWMKTRHLFEKGHHDDEDYGDHSEDIYALQKNQSFVVGISRNF